MERELLLLFTIIQNTFEESSEHQTCPQKVAEAFKTYNEFR